MSIKITGMNSGLDTDAIIRELVSASSTKKESLEKAQTKLEWKQDAWKDLNKKIKSFQATISNLRFSDAFRKKTTKVANSGLATVVTGDNAVNGSQTLAVKQLAKAGYLTGGKLSGAKGSTTLSQLTNQNAVKASEAGQANADQLKLGADDKASFSIKVGNTTTYVDLTGSSTVDEVVAKLNMAGVTASFDTTNQRFFISVAKSGESGDFQISANNENGLKALSALGLLSDEDIGKNGAANGQLAGYWDPTANGGAGGLNDASAEYVSKRANTYAEAMQKSLASAETMQGYFDAIESYQKDWEEGPMKETYDNALANYTDKDGLNAAKEQLAKDRTAWQEKTEYLNLIDRKNNLPEGETFYDAEQERLDALIAKFNEDGIDPDTITQEDLDTEAERLAQVQSDVLGAENAFKSYDSLQSAIKTQQDAITAAAKNAKILNDYYAQTNADMLTAIENAGTAEGFAVGTYADKLEYIGGKITAATANGEDTTELEKQRALLSKMAANEELYTHEGVEPSDYAYDPSLNPYNRSVREVTEEARGAYEVTQALNDSSLYMAGVSSTSVRVEGQDAVIFLNGAEFTSNSNTFTINGLTITAQSTSNRIGNDPDDPDSYETTQITTQDDIDGIYDMIKKVINQYNDLMKEIDTFYNAESAKDYEPLTAEEKDAMTDDEVKKWEEKIKSALLRHDSELGSVRNIFKEAVSSSFTIGGKKYSLADFGIFTQDYFTAGDNEKSLLHIDGNPDDEVTAGNKDLLKKMLASDPDTVGKFFNQFANSLYDKLRDASTSLKGVRSYGNFYADKTLTSQYEDYKSKIKKQEDKIAKLEDKYYKMFSAMETSMGKINSMSSYINNMFGM